VETCCHKYSTCPLWPSRSWLQEVVPSVCCLQRVFLCTKPKTAWASLPQPRGDIEQPQLMCKYDVIQKTGNMQHIRVPPEKDRATVIGNMHKKLVKIRRAVPKIWSWTDKHTHTSVPITIPRSPYQGQSKNHPNHTKTCSQNTTDYLDAGLPIWLFTLAITISFCHLFTYTVHAI